MNPTYIIVDLFCGFGGTTTGFLQAKTTSGHAICKVIACVNHDPKAIKSHWLNHPEVVHFEEDIRTLELTGLAAIVSDARAQYPDAKLILWASLECTNFSKAKGGQPRDADSRTLANHLFRYQKAILPDYIQIENVVEFMSWGPLDENGKPMSRKTGEDWMRWRNEMCQHGYTDEWRELNSADFGAYTSRNRLFGCFAKPGLPTVWPQPTHSKKGSLGMFAQLKKWKPVKEVLDFKDEGLSIFTRKKPLSDKTLERIYAGLIKYVANGDASFISKYYSGHPASKNKSVEAPADALTTKDHHSIIQADFLLKYNSTDKKGVHTPPSIDEPCPTIAAQARLGLIQPEFLSHYYGNGFCTSQNEPCPTLRTKDGAAVVMPKFISQKVQVNCNCGNNWVSTDPAYLKEPCEKCGEFEGHVTFLEEYKSKYFIDKHFNHTQNQSIHQPAGAILPTDKHRLVEATPFVMPTNFSNLPRSIEEPAPTITADRHHNYIVNPSYWGHASSVDAPCPVIIARQDKSPLYLVHAEEGSVAIAVFDCDTEVMIRIKVFMSFYGLVDIKMRMLRVSELLKIQGFPDTYQMVGNQTDQKKFIGNSVHPKVPKAWAEAMHEKLQTTYQL